MFTGSIHQKAQPSWNKTFRLTVLKQNAVEQAKIKNNEAEEDIMVDETTAIMGRSSKIEMEGVPPRKRAHTTPLPFAQQNAENIDGDENEDNS